MLNYLNNRCVSDESNNALIVLSIQTSSSANSITNQVELFPLKSFVDNTPVHLRCEQLYSSNQL